MSQKMQKCNCQNVSHRFCLNNKWTFPLHIISFVMFYVVRKSGLKWVDRRWIFMPEMTKGFYQCRIQKWSYWYGSIVFKAVDSFKFQSFNVHSLALSVRVQRPPSRIQIPASGVQTAAYRVQRPGSSIQSPESRVQGPESSIQSPVSRVQRPESSVQSQASGVQHPGPGVQSPASIQSQAFRVQCPDSNSNSCVQAPGTPVCCPIAYSTWRKLTLWAYRNSWTLDARVGHCTLDAGLWKLDTGGSALEAGL